MKSKNWFRRSVFIAITMATVVCMGGCDWGKPKPEFSISGVVQKVELNDMGPWRGPKFTIYFEDGRRITFYNSLRHVIQIGKNMTFKYRGDEDDNPILIFVHIQ